MDATKASAYFYSNKIIFWLNLVQIFFFVSISVHSNLMLKFRTNVKISSSRNGKTIGFKTLVSIISSKFGTTWIVKHICIRNFSVLLLCCQILLAIPDGLQMNGEYNDSFYIICNMKYGSKNQFRNGIT